MTSSLGDMEERLFCAFCKVEINSSSLSRELLVIGPPGCPHVSHMSCYVSHPESRFFVKECMHCLDAASAAATSGGDLNSIPSGSSNSNSGINDNQRNYQHRPPMYPPEDMPVLFGGDSRFAARGLGLAKPAGNSTIKKEGLVIFGGFSTLSDEQQMASEFVNCSLQESRVDAYIGHNIGLDSTGTQFAKFFISANDHIHTAVESCLYGVAEAAAARGIVMSDQSVLARTLAKECLWDDPRLVSHLLNVPNERTSLFPVTALDSQSRARCLRAIENGVSMTAEEVVENGVRPIDIIALEIPLMALIKRNNFTIEELSKIGFRFAGLVALGFNLSCFLDHGCFTIVRMRNAFKRDNLNLFVYLNLSQKPDYSDKWTEFITCGITLEELGILGFTFAKMQRSVTARHIEIMAKCCPLPELVSSFGLTKEILASINLLTRQFIYDMKWGNDASIEQARIHLNIRDLRELQQQSISVTTSHRIPAIQGLMGGGGGPSMQHQQQHQASFNASFSSPNNGGGQVFVTQSCVSPSAIIPITQSSQIAKNISGNRPSASSSLLSGGGGGGAGGGGTTTNTTTNSGGGGACMPPPSTPAAAAVSITAQSPYMNQMQQQRHSPYQQQQLGSGGGRTFPGKIVNPNETSYYSPNKISNGSVEGGVLPLGRAGGLSRNFKAQRVSPSTPDSQYLSTPKKVAATMRAAPSSLGGNGGGARAAPMASSTPGPSPYRQAPGMMMPNRQMQEHHHQERGGGGAVGEGGFLTDGEWSHSIGGGGVETGSSSNIGPMNLQQLRSTNSGGSQFL